MQQSDNDSLNSANGVRAAFMVALAALTLSACGSDDKPTVATSVTPVARPQASDDLDPTAKMARAVPIGGATASVNIKYEILNKPVAGAPVEIELAVIPTQGADSMTIAYAGSAGLTLSAEGAPSIDVVKSGQVERLKFSAHAQQESVFYVTVTATVYVAGTSSARVFAIPIIIGGAEVAAEPPARATKKT